MIYLYCEHGPVEADLVQETRSALTLAKVALGLDPAKEFLVPAGARCGWCETFGGRPRGVRTCPSTCAPWAAASHSRRRSGDRSVPAPCSRIAAGGPIDRVPDPPCSAGARRRSRIGPCMPLGACRRPS